MVLYPLTLLETCQLPLIRLKWHIDKHNVCDFVVSYTYSGDGLKRSEITLDQTAEESLSVKITTLVWDGSEYLQGRD